MPSGGGKGGGGGVPDIDPSALIREQAMWNRINQYGPQGNLIFADDKQSVTLEESPFQERYRQGIEDLAITMQDAAAPRAANLPLSPINTADLPQMQFTPEAFRESGDRVSQALFDRSMNLLRPELESQERSLVQGLANRGAVEGGELYTTERDRFDRSRAQQLENLALSSVGAGYDEAARQFGQAQTARAQALNERFGLRQNELAEISQLMGLTPVSPVGFQNFFAPGAVDVLGPTQMQQNAAAQNAAQAGASARSMMSGLFGLGSAAMGFF